MEFACNRKVLLLILLIILLEQIVSFEMQLYVPFEKGVFIYPYIVMDFDTYDMIAFFSGKISAFDISLAVFFLMFLLDKLFSADLQRFGAIFSAGLGLALGGMLSDALVMLLDGRSVVTYLSTTFFDIYSYTNFNLSTLCIFFGTVILVFGLFFADSAEEAAGECGMNEEPFELAEIK